MKNCAACEIPLEKHKKESAQNYRDRQCCGPVCRNTLQQMRNLRARELKRIAEGRQVPLRDIDLSAWHKQSAKACIGPPRWWR
jgi:hypothetical protein